MNGEIYLEIFPLDSGLRITAVDARSGTEVVFAAPKNCSRDRIEDLARAKLKRRLILDAKSGNASMPEATNQANTERGRLV